MQITPGSTTKILTKALFKSSSLNVVSKGTKSVMYFQMVAGENVEDRLVLVPVVLAGGCPSGEVRRWDGKVPEWEER